MMTHHRRHKAQARPHIIAKYLMERGHTVKLIVTAETARTGIVESEWDGVPIVEMPDLLFGKARAGWDVWNAYNRTRYLKNENNWDLVHCFETRLSTIYPAMRYVKQHNLPWITDWNDWWGRGGIIAEARPRWYQILFGPAETYYEEAFRTKADGLTVISRALGKRAEGLGMPADHILRLPGGTLPELFQSRTTAECRVHMGLPEEGVILGFSSMDSHFDLELVMRSAAIVKEKFPDLKILITGRAGEEVRQIASQHGMENNLHLTGFLPFEELPWALGCANLFLLPFPEKVYNVGRWPNKIGDYMSIGRPTVSNPVGDIKPLFEEDRIGLLAAEEAGDFADKILCLLEQPELARELGENARRTAVEKYDWRVLIGKLEDFYVEVLERTKATKHVTAV